eukprot:jgi/Chlat1/4680/Chrsp3S05612
MDGQQQHDDHQDHQQEQQVQRARNGDHPLEGEQRNASQDVNREDSPEALQAGPSRTVHTPAPGTSRWICGRCRSMGRPEAGYTACAGCKQNHFKYRKKQTSIQHFGEDGNACVYPPCFQELTIPYAEVLPLLGTLQDMEGFQLVTHKGPSHKGGAKSSERYQCNMHSKGCRVVFLIDKLDKFPDATQPLSRVRFRTNHNHMLEPRVQKLHPEQVAFLRHCAKAGKPLLQAQTEARQHADELGYKNADNTLWCPNASQVRWVYQNYNASVQMQAESNATELAEPAEQCQAGAGSQGAPEQPPTKVRGRPSMWRRGKLAQKKESLEESVRNFFAEAAGDESIALQPNMEPDDTTDFRQVSISVRQKVRFICALVVKLTSGNRGTKKTRLAHAVNEVLRDAALHLQQLEGCSWGQIMAGSGVATPDVSSKRGRKRVRMETHSQPEHHAQGQERVEERASVAMQHAPHMAGMQPTMPHQEQRGVFGYGMHDMHMASDINVHEVVQTLHALGYHVRDARMAGGHLGHMKEVVADQVMRAMQLNGYELQEAVATCAVSTSTAVAARDVALVLRRNTMHQDAMLMPQQPLLHLRH